MSFSGRMGDLMKKYGKVAIGVHLGVSFASIGGLYAAIKNNVDVESLFQKVGLSSGVTTSTDDDKDNSAAGESSADVLILDKEFPPQKGTRNRTAEMAATSGGALALAILCNKALIPVRVPITIALTPPIARFLARRNLIKSL